METDLLPASVRCVRKLDGRVLMEVTSLSLPGSTNTVQGPKVISNYIFGALHLWFGTGCSERNNIGSQSLKPLECQF